MAALGSPSVEESFSNALVLRSPASVTTRGDLIPSLERGPGSSERVPAPNRVSVGNENVDCTVATIKLDLAIPHGPDSSSMPYSRQTKVILAGDGREHRARKKLKIWELEARARNLI